MKVQSPSSPQTKLPKQQNDPSEKSEAATPFGLQKPLDFNAQASGTAPNQAAQPGGLKASHKLSKEALDSEPELSGAPPDRGGSKK